MEKEKRKEFLKKIYEKDYKNKFFDSRKEECSNVIKQWKEYYRKKIIEGTLSIDEYTNRIGSSKEYLTHFLNVTASVFGRSREGNTKQLMLQMNKDENTYYIGKTESPKNNEKIDASKDEAEKYYKSYILPLLQETINAAKSIDSLKQFENNTKYSDFICKQMIQKIFVLESLLNNGVDYSFCLLHIFKNDVIDKLCDFFELDIDSEGRAIKSYTVIKQCYDDLNIDDSSRDLKTAFEVSKMLWRIFNIDFSVSAEQPNVILYGAPGTGKTYEVKNYINLLTKGDDNRVIYIQCHPGFSYEDFIEGLKPTGVTKEGNIKLEVVNGLFKELCLRAKKDLDNEYFFIADEINRANLSSMFGETLSLIEPSYRDYPEDSNKRNIISTPLSKLISQLDDNTKAKLSYEIVKDEVKFGVPHNIRFIGMMNDTDKSIDSFDLALRRRFVWIRKEFDSDIIFDELSDKYDENDLRIFVNGCIALNNFIKSSNNNGLGFGKSYEFGHSYFLEIKSYTKKNTKRITRDSKNKLFDCHLAPVLTEYIRSFKDENEIDGIVKSARKIFNGE